VKDATAAVTKAAADAKKAITEADAASRREFTKSVAAAKEDLNVEVRRIFGGDSPELLERLQPLLDMVRDCPRRQEHRQHQRRTCQGRQAV
jgi:hypothetical protein